MESIHQIILNSDLFGAHDPEFIVPDGAGNKLLGRRSCVESEPHVLRPALSLWYRKRELELLPGRRNSDDHWAFPYRDRCRTGACDAPPQAAPAGNITPILALELVSAGRKHGYLRYALEIHASVPKLDEEGALGVPVGSRSNGCRDARSHRNDPIEWKSGGGKFKAAVEQQAGVSELLGRQ